MFVVSLDCWELLFYFLDLILRRVGSKNNKIMALVKNHPYIALKLIGIFGKKKMEKLRSSWIVSILPFCLGAHTLFSGQSRGSHCNKAHTVALLRKRTQLQG